MHSVDRFVAALAGGDPLDGIRLLDELERDGRDLVAFADQVVARLREQLIEALAGGPARRRSWPETGPRRASPRRPRRQPWRRGGYRLQLELALLDGGGSVRPCRSSREPSAQPRRRGPAATRSPSRDPAPVQSKPSDHRQRSVAVAVESAAPEPRGRAAIASARSQPAAARVAAVELARSRLSRTRRTNRCRTCIAVWPSVVERIAGNPANRPLIAACRPVEVRDATIVLGFPESQAFLRDIAERKRASIEAGIGHVLGRAVAVACVATNVELAEPEAVLAQGTADDLVAQARRVFGDDLRRRGRGRIEEEIVGYGNMAKMAQQMQADMARVQAELGPLTVEGTAGGGAVTAIVNGHGELVSMTHRPGRRRSGRRRDAPGPCHRGGQRHVCAQVKQVTEEKMARVTGGLRIPGYGLKWRH